MAPAAARTGSALAFALACDPEPDIDPDPSSPVEDVSRSAAAPPEPAVEAESEPTPPPLHAIVDSPSEEIDKPASAPIMIRIARQLLLVHAEPDAASAIRGRIPMSETFEVFARVEGPDCGGLGWADVGHGGFACLERTRKGQASSLRALPVIRDRGTLPFLYAQVPTGRVAHRWASEAEWVQDHAPAETLEANHDYAFIYRKRVRGENLLYDDRRRVVPEAQVRVYRPSAFAGRDLENEAVPEGSVLAWAAAWPDTFVRVGPGENDEVARTVEYQSELYLAADTATGSAALALADGSGFVQARDVRRFTPPAALDGIATDETWIDVDLDQQVLTVVRGETPIFATLVSSGFKTPTPRGVYRISVKQAVGAMSSEAGADDPYAVEAVPYVQYFHNSFALHGAYWHHRFGHRISHGCINLAPKDAKRIYEMTSPAPRAGWLHVYEAPRHLGTSVRVHRGLATVPDRRGPVEPVFP